MSESENSTDLVKRVTSATLKAIAHRTDLNVSYSQADAAYASADEVTLPAVIGSPDAASLTKIRGISDSMALRARFNDPKLHKTHLPHGAEAKAVFEAIEQVRCESLGSNRMIGVAANLDALLLDRCRTRGYGEMQERDEAPFAEVVGLLAREHLCPTPLPAEAKHIVDMWRSELEKKIGPQLEALSEHAKDQEAFANIVEDILKELKLIEDDDANGETSEDHSEDDQEQQGDEDSGSTEESEAEQDGMQASDQDESASADDAETQDGAEDDMVPGQGEENPRGPTDYFDNLQASPLGNRSLYQVYTNAFDEVIEANDLCEPDELSRLRQQLDQQLYHIQDGVSKLANRLQRLLMSKQQRSWEFDLEEGILDAGRLSRVVTAPTHPLSFKLELETDFRDTVVTMLIDNSGSMRGRPISVAAMCADILARTLERCNVKVEILGFTTRTWKGGKSRDKWVNDNKPESPGRLNDIRHIIYKSADMPWRRARKNLGLMLREGLLKENIDGEALLWAHNRLLGRPEQRRILMIISDGAPVDDATLSTNPGNYLEKHLRNVIEYIETRSNVELLAIGIGHDVTRYYQRAVTIVDAEDLGGTMMKNLTELFEEETGSHRRRFA